MTEPVKAYTLRSHIPIAGPGMREPCRGDESDFRVSIGFTPQWYRDRVGVDFSERWHQDPVYRYETLEASKRYLEKRFPSIEHFRLSYTDGIEPSCATLSGVYGAILIPALYKPNVTFFCNNWPSLNTQEIIPRDKLRQLPPIDPESNPILRDIVRQMDEIERRWGMISGYAHGYQGVLNTAFRLRGQDVFMDMVEEPEFVHELFGHICHTIIQTNQFIQDRQRRSGFEVDLCTSANCVVNMISPAMYEEFVLPYDMKISESFQRYGVHTCNWDATPYIDGMRRIPKVGYIDMGIDTDMRRMREVFPDARRGVIYSVLKVARADMAEIERDFERVHDELGPCDIILADIETDVPDERIRNIIALADRIGHI